MHVVGVLPRISRERFAAVLLAAGSPAAPEADACWAAVAREGVDPLFALAIFHHESRFGTVGIVPQYDLRNPGATRTSRTGEGEAVSVPGRGQFWRYPTWEAGFRDLARRLVDPNFVYRRQGAETVEAIVPLWAPASDGNNPASYIAAVRAFMAQHAQEPLSGVPLRIDWVPRGARNRPGFALRPEWITIHETANEAPGADAEAHRRFVHAGGGPEGVSFHFVVDDREVVQLLPTIENGWHAGDGPNGPGNRTSVAIETCVNSDADWGRTLQNLVALVAELCRVLRLGTDRVVQHNRWSGKNCPARIRREGRWDWLLAQVGERLSQAQAGGEVVQLGPYGRHVGHGFLVFWRRLEQVDPTLPLRVLGWPITEEFELDGAVCQVFERSVLKWSRTEPAPWDVHVALFEDAVRARMEAQKQGLISGS